MRVEVPLYGVRGRQAGVSEGTEDSVGESEAWAWVMAGGVGYDLVSVGVDSDDSGWAFWVETWKGLQG